MNWVEGWQGGLVLGAAISIAAEALIVTLVLRHRRLRGPKPEQCPVCKGEIDDDGLGVGAVHKLVFCPECFDTVPRSCAGPDSDYRPIREWWQV